MTPAQASKAKLIVAFAAIYIIWGSTYLAIKYALESMPPFALGGTRFLIAGSILFVWARLRRNVEITRQHWLHAFALAALLFGAGNGAVVWSQQHIDSGIVALLVAIVPLWVVTIEWIRPGGHRPRVPVISGVLLGLAGMVFLVGPSVFADADINLIATTVLIGGSLAWSIATVFAKKTAAPKDPLVTSALQLLGGGVWLSLMSLVAGELPRIQPSEFSMRAILSFGYLVVFGSIIAFSAYSWLMRVASPARIATYAYVNPVVAMLLGWAFAGERLTLGTIFAAGLILTGVALITSGMNRQ